MELTELDHQKYSSPTTISHTELPPPINEKRLPSYISSLKFYLLNLPALMRSTNLTDDPSKLAKFLKAVEWLFSLTTVYAIFMLGECYENGWGIEQNLIMAKKLYETASEKGCTIAARTLFRISLFTEPSTSLESTLVNPEPSYSNYKSVSQQLG